MNVQGRDETHVKLISLRNAQRIHPHSWSEIQSQIAEVRQTSEADIIQLAARIVAVEGHEMLEVVCVTDLVEDGDMETPATGMRFRAPLIAHVASAMVH